MGDTIPAAVDPPASIPLWWSQALWANYNALAVAVYLRFCPVDRHGWTIAHLHEITRACDNMNETDAIDALSCLYKQGILVVGPHALTKDGAYAYRLNEVEPDHLLTRTA